jgi:biotin synthase
VAEMLATAGGAEYNLNLEAASSFYPQICTTHSFEERINTINYVKAAGMRVCSGGILGLGELPSQRVELALELKKLKVNTVPLNFYHHIDGNPVNISETGNISPLDALKIVSVFRFIMPEVILKIAGGRENTLEEFQSLMLLTGANSIMVGNYLTTTGRRPEVDMELINKCGMFVADPSGQAVEIKA